VKYELDETLVSPSASTFPQGSEAMIDNTTRRNESGRTSWNVILLQVLLAATAGWGIAVVLLSLLRRREPNPDPPRVPGGEQPESKYLGEQPKSQYPLGNQWPFPLLRDPAWEGVGTLLSVLTFVVAIVLTFFVAKWTISQEQAHLFIHPPNWRVSQDLTEWRIEVVIDNDGPPTATDLTVGTRLAVSPHITLTHLAILHQGSSAELVKISEGGTIPWSVILDEGLQPIQIEFRDYEGFIDRLSVGDQIVIQADFTADPSFSQRLTRAVQSGDFWSFESARRGWASGQLRAFFIHDASVSGNKVIATKSNLWEPPRFR